MNSLSALSSTKTEPTPFRLLALFSSLLLLLTFSCLAALHAAEAAQRPTKPAPAKVRISQSALAARSTALWIAQEKGRFAKHGVDIEVVYLRTALSR